ncbi:MAG: protein kinase [Planctomycetes bacterium]|nr:protein kinase [Planctomycetota bacterium]
MTERTVWGDFEINFASILGRGGMGAVYRGRQISLDRPVAVKVLDTSDARDPQIEQAFLEKFRSEARELARVRDPHIVTVFQAGRNDGRYWYAMELIDGVTIEQRLGRDGMFEELEAARIARDVARALDAARRQGIVHRDVKSANIFLLKDGTTKLGDFGIARRRDAPPGRLTQAHAVVGTPAYVSPEQALGRETDHRSDLYSLGIVLYEMLTERTPFSGLSPLDTLYKHLDMPPEPPRLFNPRVSPGMEAIVLRCIEKSPADRYATYADLIDDLESILARRRPKHLEPRSTPPSPLSWLAAAVGAVGLVLIVGRIHAFASRPTPVAAPLQERRPISPDELALIDDLCRIFTDQYPALRERSLETVFAALDRLEADSRGTAFTEPFVRAARELLESERCLSGEAAGAYASALRGDDARAARIPVALTVAMEDAGALAQDERIEAMREALRSLADTEEAALRRFDFLEPHFRDIRAEIEALDLLAQQQWGRLLARYPRTRVRSVAAQRLYEAFLRRTDRDLLAGMDAILEWELQPDEATSDERALYWTTGCEPDGSPFVILQDPKAMRTLTRKEDVPGAKEGILIDYQLAGAGAFRIALENASDLVIRQESLELAKPMPLPPAGSEEPWRTLALIPGEDHLLVYINGRLQASLVGAAVPRRPIISVIQAKLELKHLRTAPAP